MAKAHPADGADAAAQAVRGTLLARYQAAIYRYLLAATRDADAADDLFQDFGVKFVRGDFRAADPCRGRFRDLVKTSLINLVINHQRLRARRPTAAAEADAAVEPSTELAEADRAFLVDWRRVLLDRAWDELARLQKKSRAAYYDVLRMRAESPDGTAVELARRLSEDRHPSVVYTEAGVRKMLQRARELFADLLVSEIAASLEDASTDVLEQEVIELGFHAWCREALERRRKRRGQ